MSTSTTKAGRAALRAIAANEGAETTVRLPTLRRLEKAGLITLNGRRARLTPAGRKRLEWHARRGTPVPVDTGALRSSIRSSIPFWTNPKPERPSWLGEGALTDAERTFQEWSTVVGTRPELRPPHNLLVSDLGTHFVGTALADAGKLPAGVMSFQVVDAHHGYGAAEAWLLAAGFGCARSFHYEALGVVSSFHDGEGRLVTRWLRLFVRGAERGSLETWRG